MSVDGELKDTLWEVYCLRALAWKVCRRWKWLQAELVSAMPMMSAPRDDTLERKYP